jgi:phosphoribosylformimino-5-aminoimidazole carboxamide ribonucleotide (ProFAR) isomerase
MSLHRDADELHILLSGTLAATPIRMVTEMPLQAPEPMIVSYDLNKVMAAARGWQAKAAAAPDPAAGEAYRRSAAQFERLVMRSLDTPPIC